VTTACDQQLVELWNPPSSTVNECVPEEMSRWADNEPDDALNSTRCRSLVA
jgi:hypothetical protein